MNIEEKNFVDVMLRTLRNILIAVVLLIVAALTVYDTHTDLIIACEKVHAKCQLIAVPTASSLNGGE